MKTGTKGWVFVSGIMMAALLTSCTRIEPDQVGVRTKNLARGKGIVPRDQGPGFHRFLWPMDSWHRFPSTVQRVHFGRTTGRPDVITYDAIDLTSADGDRVVLSAEALFRITENEAHRVLQDSGYGTRYLEVAAGLAQDAARALFGRLHTEEFYDVDQREAARREVRKLLGERLAARHMTLVDFLVERIEFSPDYESLIRAKKVADQKVELEKAKSRAAEERGKVTLVRTRTDTRLQALQKEADIDMMKARTEYELKMAGLQAEANKYAAERAADGHQYEGVKKAESIRLAKTAEAESIRLMNEALEGDGARNLVARETVKGLNMPDMMIASDGYPWLSPRKMALRLGGETLMETGAEER
ncbi:MAG: hypothetical protein EOM20_10715 [Spartobacteria bacterium]|nr:hypothetical protein [Spartobacteria bacterium]